MNVLEYLITVRALLATMSTVSTSFYTVKHELQLGKHMPNVELQTQKHSRDKLANIFLLLFTCQ